MFQSLMLLKNLWIHDKMNIYYVSQMEKRAVIFGVRKKIVWKHATMWNKFLVIVVRRKLCR